MYIGLTSLQGYDLPANPYPQDQGAIDVVRAVFGPIWEGLTNTNVPGFDFSFAAMFIALLTAGLIGLILKTGFQYFGSHLTDGPVKRGSGKRRGSKGEE